MMRWEFEPGHTDFSFRARHMMVTYVRGHFKNVSGTFEFDPAHPEKASISMEIDAKTLWTGVKERDDHLRSGDFFAVEKYPKISFKSSKVAVIGECDYRLTGVLTIRSITKEVTLDVRYLGQWQTPWWEDGVNKGPKTRSGFRATGTINRHDWKVSWNDVLDRGGVVVSDEIDLEIDIEGILVDSRNP